MNAKAALLLVLTAGCTDPDPPVPDAPDDVVRQHVMTMTPNLDLLFVIDDSASMADKQLALNRGFAALLAQLQQADGGLPNLHLGVVSTDLGTSAGGGGTPAPNIGTLGQGGCVGFGKEGKLLKGTAAIEGAYLSIARDGTDNFSGTIVEAFDAMSKLGAGGCGFEQQLGAMRTALEANAFNAGFVRESANLGVIVLSDEDDCSARDPSLFAQVNPELGVLDSFRCFRAGVECVEDVTTIGVKTGCKSRADSAYVADIAPYRDFLLGMKQGEARRVMFGAIVADPAKVTVETRMTGGSETLAVKHACDFATPTGMAVADPGVRLGALATQLGGKTVSICNDDLTAQAGQLGAALKRLVNDTCLPEAVATSDCVVTDHNSDGTTADVAFTLVDDASCAGMQRVQRTQPGRFDSYATLSCASL